MRVHEKEREIPSVSRVRRLLRATKKDKRANGKRIEGRRGKETVYWGRMRPHKGSGALLIRELIGMPRMPTTMEPGGWVIPSLRVGGIHRGSLEVPV